MSKEDRIAIYFLLIGGNIVANVIAYANGIDFIRTSVDGFCLGFFFVAFFGEMGAFK